MSIDAGTQRWYILASSLNFGFERIQGVIDMTLGLWLVLALCAGFVFGTMLLSSARMSRVVRSGLGRRILWFLYVLGIGVAADITALALWFDPWYVTVGALMLLVGDGVFMVGGYLLLSPDVSFTDGSIAIRADSSMAYALKDLGVSLGRSYNLCSISWAMVFYGAIMVLWWCGAALFGLMVLPVCLFLILGQNPVTKARRVWSWMWDSNVSVTWDLDLTYWGGMPLSPLLWAAIGAAGYLIASSIAIYGAMWPVFLRGIGLVLLALVTVVAAIWLLIWLVKHIAAAQGGQIKSAVCPGVIFTDPDAS